MNTIPICPKCGSTNVKSAYLASPAELTRPGSKQLSSQIKKHPIGSILIGWQPENPSVFICQDCDYYGICPEISKSNAKKFKKDIKKSK